MLDGSESGKKDMLFHEEKRRVQLRLEISTELQSYFMDTNIIFGGYMAIRMDHTVCLCTGS